MLPADSEIRQRVEYLFNVIQDETNEKINVMEKSFLDSDGKVLYECTVIQSPDQNFPDIPIRRDKFDDDQTLNAVITLILGFVSEKIEKS